MLDLVSNNGMEILLSNKLDIKFCYLMIIILKFYYLSLIGSAGAKESSDVRRSIYLILYEVKNVVTSLFFFLKIYLHFFFLHIF